MIDKIRNNIVELSIIHLNKKYVWNETGPSEFDNPGFTYYIYQELFNLDIEESGYGIDNTTKQMTNDIGTLRQYNENDKKKKDYLSDINIGDLLFFHTESLEEKTPTPSNHYPGHIAIYIGNNKFIHADETKGKVTINDIDEYWLNILVASRDIVSGILKKTM